MSRKIVMLETVYFLVGQDGTQEGASYDTQQEAEEEVKRRKKHDKMTTYKVHSRTSQVTE